MIKKLLVSLLFYGAVSANAQNNYLMFDGTNDHVNVPNSGTILGTATTISMTCKVFPKNPSPAWPAFNGIVGYRNDSNFDFYIIQLSSNSIEARFRNASGTTYDIVYSGLTLNAWNHFYMVFNGSTLKLYKDGVEVGSVAASGSAPATNSSTFKIGLITYSTTNFQHTGYIDEVSLWNKALSAAEITAIHTNAGEIANPASETNLKLYYKFNQGVPFGNNASVTSLIDEKALQNGTLTNFGLNGNNSNWGTDDDLSSANFNENTLKVYPNPTNAFLNISGIANEGNLQIIDNLGRVVSEQTTTGDNLQINVSLLKSGMYFVKIENAQLIRFVKK